MFLKGPSVFWHHFSIIHLTILSDIVVENHMIDLLENLKQSDDLSKMTSSYLSWPQAFLMLAWLGMTTNDLEGIIHPWSTFWNTIILQNWIGLLSSKYNTIKLRLVHYIPIYFHCVEMSAWDFCKISCYMEGTFFFPQWYHRRTLFWFPKEPFSEQFLKEPFVS